MYARTPLASLQDLREEVAALELDLNDSDEEMVSLKAITWHLLNLAEKMNAKSDTLELAVDAVEQALEQAVVIKDGEPGEGELTVAQARQDLRRGTSCSAQSQRGRIACSTLT